MFSICVVLAAVAELVHRIIRHRGQNRIQAHRANWLDQGRELCVPHRYAVEVVHKVLAVAAPEVLV